MKQQNNIMLPAHPTITVQIDDLPLRFPSSSMKHTKNHTTIIIMPIRNILNKNKKISPSKNKYNITNIQRNKEWKSNHKNYKNNTKIKRIKMQTREQEFKVTIRIREELQRKPETVGTQLRRWSETIAITQRSNGTRTTITQRSD